MKYALGEILLIMIGILLALQVQNWNEDRQDRKQEIKILINLRQDFTTNLEKLDAVLKNYGDMDESNLISTSLVKCQIPFDCFG